MITDQLTNTIYFSHMLEQVCPDLYRSISTLKAKGYIFMPARSKNADCIEDTTVRRQFELRFPEYPKENIIPIYALEALKQEGGLHCCSWNILK